MRFEPPKEQVGDKYTPKFRSITTPNRAFYLMDAIAEFVLMQRYGLDLPAYFWKKSVSKKLSTEYKKIKNQLFGMIKRKKNITALELLSVVFDKIPETKITKTETQENEVLAEEDSPVFEIHTESKKPHNVLSALKDLGDKVG